MSIKKIIKYAIKTFKLYIAYLFDFRIHFTNKITELEQK